MSYKAACTEAEYFMSVFTKVTVLLLVCNIFDFIRIETDYSTVYSDNYTVFVINP